MLQLIERNSRNSVNKEQIAADHRIAKNVQSSFQRTSSGPTLVTLGPT